MPDLFRHAMGGYGLFGVITELELDMVPNALLAPRFEEMSGTRARGAVRGARSRRTPPFRWPMAGWTSRSTASSTSALLITYRPAGDQSQFPRASGSGFVSRASRYLFRAQVESDRAKRLRWWTEAELGPSLAGDATRNTLMNEPVITLDDRDPFRTDILHEYFVAAGPLRRLRGGMPGGDPLVVSAAPQHHAALRRTPIRDSVLAYAPEPRIAAVLLFSQEKTARGEARHGADDRTRSSIACWTSAAPTTCLTGRMPRWISCRAAIRAPPRSPSTKRETDRGSAVPQ